MCVIIYICIYTYIYIYTRMTDMQPAPKTVTSCSGHHRPPALWTPRDAPGTPRPPGTPTDHKNSHMSSN